MENFKFRNRVSGFSNEEESETKDSNSQQGGNRSIDDNQWSNQMQVISSLDSDSDPEEVRLRQFQGRRKMMKNNKFRRRSKHREKKWRMLNTAFENVIKKEDRLHLPFFDYIGHISLFSSFSKDRKQNVFVRSVLSRYQINRMNECLSFLNRDRIECKCDEHKNGLFVVYAPNRAFHHHPMRTLKEAEYEESNLQFDCTLRYVIRGSPADINCLFVRECQLERCFDGGEVFSDNSIRSRGFSRLKFVDRGQTFDRFLDFGLYAIQINHLPKPMNREVFKSPGVLIYSLDIVHQTKENFFKHRHNAGKIMLGLMSLLECLNDKTDCPTTVAAVVAMDEKACLSDYECFNSRCLEPRNILGNYYPCANLINAFFRTEIMFMDSDGCLLDAHDLKDHSLIPAEYTRQLINVNHTIDIIMLKDQFAFYGSTIEAMLIFLESIWKLAFDYIHGVKHVHKFNQWMGSALDLTYEFPSPEYFSFGNYAIRTNKYGSRLLHIFPFFIYLYIFPKLTAIQLRTMIGGFDKMQLLVVDSKKDLARGLINIGHFYVSKDFFSATRLTNASHCIC